MQFLSDYANKFNLSVQYNTHIKLVSRDGDPVTGYFRLKDQNEIEYRCKDVVIRYD